MIGFEDVDIEEFLKINLFCNFKRPHSRCWFFNHMVAVFDIRKPQDLCNYEKSFLRKFFSKNMIEIISMYLQSKSLHFKEEDPVLLIESKKQEPKYRRMRRINTRKSYV